MRPLPLVVSVCWWSVLTLSAFAYATFIAARDRRSPEGYLGAAVLGILFFLTCSLLWFLWSYWQGYDWTREFVMIGIAVKVLHYLWRVWHVRWVRFALLVVGATLDFVFSQYIFYRLTTRQGRTYFTPVGGTSRLGVVS
jgi:hypothetical protein